LNLPQIKSIIKKLLHAAGLEIRPQRYTLAGLQTSPLTKTAGTILEFVGTQAVGKSTLYKACLPTIQSRWYFRHNLEGLNPESITSDRADHLHRDIFFNKMNRLDARQLDTTQSATIARQMAFVIRESLLISSHAFPRGFVLEEGLFKNFPEEVLDLSVEDAAPLWENRAFVHLRARDPDLAVERYQGRATDRRNRGIFQHQRSNDEVRCRIEADNLLFDQMIETARALDCPTFVVYAEDNFQCAVQDVLEFEKSLIL
jgi:hypothetical protein